MGRILVMGLLVTAKALVGHEKFHPVEQLFELCEVAAIYFAGVHAAHKHAHKQKEAHGH